MFFGKLSVGRIGEFKLNTIGGIPAYLKVFQVIDDDEMIVEQLYNLPTGRRHGGKVWIKGNATETPR